MITVTKTNGVIVQLGYTNTLVVSNPALALSNLVNQINTAPALQGPDGLFAEDFSSGIGAPNCNMVARSPGLRASEIKVMLSSSGALVGSPGEATSLNANLADLQPRNHLYLAAGAAELGVNFALNTMLLPDGYHELEAVAYEGTHIRTQTHIVLPIRIENTSLAANLVLQDLAATNSVSGSYSIQVTANTSNISSITVFSTGGALATATNQFTATFNISGTALGVGVHPLYAVVQDQSGRRYRTETRTVRFISP